MGGLELGTKFTFIDGEDDGGEELGSPCVCARKIITGVIYGPDCENTAGTSVAKAIAVSS